MLAPQWNDPDDDDRAGWLGGLFAIAVWLVVALMWSLVRWWLP